MELIGADLHQTNLGKADLSFANLLRANLRGADLCRALLTRANLLGADLREVDFSDTELDRPRARAQVAPLVLVAA